MTLYYTALAAALAGDYRKLAKLKRRYGTWERAYEALRGAQAPAIFNAVPNLIAAQEALTRSQSAFIFAEDDGFPPLLREIAQPPFGIYVRGTLPVQMSAPDIAPAPDAVKLAFAIVGTRRATPEGCAIARRFARELAQAGSAIVSGLAFGIDAAAHEGCLDANGTTVAVLAGGLNKIYPRENTKLAEKILVAGGAIVSEYPPGVPPYPVRFLERNRLISGLARGALIVEAPFGSGSLATARFALEQNRDVFVVPGSIAQKNFEGSHRLIRQGATLVTAPEEILEAYGIVRKDAVRARMGAQSDAYSPEEALILQVLADIAAPAEVDKIATATKLEPRVVNQTLSFLLFRDIVKETKEGYTI